MSEIIIVENNSEIAAGTRGSSLAIEAIKMAAVNKNNNLFSKYKNVKIKNENYRVWNDIVSVYAKRIDGVIKLYERIVKKVTPILNNDDFPLIISGDHSNAGGSIAALKIAYPSKRIGVVWIDAHADLHSPYTTPSGNMHGMPLASALAEDNMPQKINEPIAETVEKWDYLKNIGGIKPKLLTSDLVFVGVRSVEKPEKNIIDTYSIPNFTTKDLVLKGVESIAKAILEKLKECEVIYISFDVDSMDMELSEGTGTPVKDGLSKHQALELIKKLVEDKRVKMFEVVEVNPLLDKKGNLMAEMALESIVEVINVVEGR
jgi:arginase